MRPRIDLRFRPTLLIFVDETGKHICEQLKILLQFTQLDPMLCQSIGLLQVSSTTMQTYIITPENPSPVTSNAQPLAHMLIHTMKNIQASRRIMEMTNAGYPIPNPRTQIYIIGDATSPRLPGIHDVVQQQLHQMDMHTLLCYVLYRSHTRQQQTPIHNNLSLHPEAFKTSPLTETNFSYLYEDMLTYPIPSFVSEGESYYAVAEALFTLLATGLTTEPFFEEIVRGNSGVSQEQNVGSLSTSLIISPQQAIQNYCSTRLAADLLTQWITDLQQANIPENSKRDVQAKAQHMAYNIESWIMDKVERPLADDPGNRALAYNPHIIERKWPTLDILARNMPQVAQKQPFGLHEQLVKQTEQLFYLFWTDAVRQKYARRRWQADTWTEIVTQQHYQAHELYKEWDAQATLAWDATTERICIAITSTLDKLWSDEETGLELTTIYINELEQSLKMLLNRQATLRNTHQRDYTEALHLFDEVSRGPWTQIAYQDDQSTQSFLPPQEQQIVQQLEQRILWQQEQLIPFASQIIAAIPFIIAVLFATVTFPVFKQSFNSVVIVTVAVFILSGIMHLLARRHRLKKVREVQEDLLSFYRRYYAYQCELREDELRTSLMKSLQEALKSVRTRITTVTQHLPEVQKQLLEQASHIQHELFHSSASSRDILVANGERLQKDTRNTLHDLFEQVTQMRNRKPLESWHQTIQSLNKQLSTQLRQKQESLLEMSQPEVYQRFLSFAQNVTHSYCQGALTDIHNALAKQDTWHEALDRAEKLLYSAQVGVRQPQFIFVCGREQDLQKGLPHLPSDTYPVYISNAHPWVLVAAFYRGGLLPETNDQLPATNKVTLETNKPLPETNINLSAIDNVLPPSRDLP